MRLKYLSTVFMLVFTIGTAKATTFNWTVSGDPAFGITGNGTLTAVESGGQYHVDSISGQVSNSCTGSPCVPLYRNIIGILKPHQAYASIGDIGGDNLLFPATPSAFLDGQGLVFAVGGTNGDPCPFLSGCYMNIYDSPNAFGGAPWFAPQYALYVSNAGPNTVDFALTPGATDIPVPASLPLFAAGLGVMGWLARRRKRKSAAEFALT